MHLHTVTPCVHVALRTHRFVLHFEHRTIFLALPPLGFMCPATYNDCFPSVNDVYAERQECVYIPDKRCGGLAYNWHFVVGSRRRGWKYDEQWRLIYCNVHVSYYPWTLFSYTASSVYIKPSVTGRNPRATLGSVFVPRVLEVAPDLSPRPWWCCARTCSHRNSRKHAHAMGISLGDQFTSWYIHQQVLATLFSV